MAAKNGIDLIEIYIWVNRHHAVIIIKSNLDSVWDKNK